MAISVGFFAHFVAIPGHFPAIPAALLVTPYLLEWGLDGVRGGKEEAMSVLDPTTHQHWDRDGYRVYCEPCDGPLAEWREHWGAEAEVEADAPDD